MREFPETQGLPKAPGPQQSQYRASFLTRAWSGVRLEAALSIGISNGVFTGPAPQAEEMMPGPHPAFAAAPVQRFPCADTPIAWRSEQDDGVPFLRTRPALGCSPSSAFHRWTGVAQAKLSSASRGAGARGCARAGKPKCVRIFTTAALSRIAATSLRSPPQSGQRSTSTLNTRRRSVAHHPRAAPWRLHAGLWIAGRVWQHLPAQPGIGRQDHHLGCEDSLGGQVYCSDPSRSSHLP